MKLSVFNRSILLVFHNLYKTITNNNNTILIYHFWGLRSPPKKKAFKSIQCL